MADLIKFTAEALPAFVYDSSCPGGVVKIAGKVCDDFKRVLGARPTVVKRAAKGKARVIFGIAGESELLEGLGIDLGAVQGKNEVYGFFVQPENGRIVIAGSDKRGVIYGLFHLSELMGVSPLVDWSDVKPQKRDEVSLSEGDSFISREPSVRYRGFFINDEWPAFGTWANRRFGGINAKMYEHVFELLLRLKGNYLWPAMWSGCFACDGPGLKSAELANEYGVIMGLSHHEPCLRHGEEYSKLRGKGSIYGDAWDFRKNKKGITNFWRDGLKRNGHLENIITVGMRGERDSTILGKEATLKDNIELLESVLKTQNKLIREEVNSDLEKVPRMLALYKEVEPYYYGDSETEGLKNNKELEDVILMLCDDNHGYVRSLPDEEMRSHKGGFGMYYHFDYHGDPVSYEWINSTHLPEVWEQLTACYEHGVQKLWIVNVGDLGLQELPLSYFMDLAYDYDKWGVTNLNSAEEYLSYWVKKQFGGDLEEKDLLQLAEALGRFTRLIHNRRPEHLGRKVYSVQGFGEAEEVLKEALDLEFFTEGLERKISEEQKAAFTELISYNVLGGANLIKMWVYSSLNRFYAKMGAAAANGFGDMVRQCLDTDYQLRVKLHTVGGGEFSGFGLAEHIGFKHWNSEECAMPVIESVVPVSRGEIKVGLMYEKGVTAGQDWTGKTLELRRFVKEGEIRRAGFFVALCGAERVEYTLANVTPEKDWLILDANEGAVDGDNGLREHFIVIDDTKLKKNDTATVEIKYKLGRVRINVTATRKARLGKNTHAEDNGIIAFDADKFSRKTDTGECAFTVIKDLGRRGSGVKILPVTAELGGAVPVLEYKLNAESAGEFELCFMLKPNNPYKFGAGVSIAYNLNDGILRQLDVLGDSYEAGVCEQWAQGVLEHIRHVKDRVKLKKGVNILRFYGISRETVLERIVLVREGEKVPKSYFGPKTSI